MNCNKVRKHLSLLAGGELDGNKALPYREHLKGCLTCFREYQEYLDMRESLRTLREKPDLEPVLAGLSDDVLCRLREEPIGPAAPIHSSPLRRSGLLAAAAAVLLVFFGAIFLMDSFSNQSPGPNGEGVYTGTGDPGGKNSGTGNSEFPRWNKARSESDDEAEKVDRRLDRIPLTPEELPSVQPAFYRRGF